MKTKFLLPIMAMLFAIGISFAAIDRAADPSTDYILVNGTFEPIGVEVDCEIGVETCRVQLEPNGPIYSVYDAADPNTLKKGSGRVIPIWQ